MELKQHDEEKENKTHVRINRTFMELKRDNISNGEWDHTVLIEPLWN